jgi:hypothetical protein
MLDVFTTNGPLSSNQSQDHTQIAKDIIELEKKLSKSSVEPDKARDISVSSHHLLLNAKFSQNCNVVLVQLIAGLRDR